MPRTRASIQRDAIYTLEENFQISDYIEEFRSKRTLRKAIREGPAARAAFEFDSLSDALALLAFIYAAREGCDEVLSHIIKYKRIPIEAALFYVAEGERAEMILDECAERGITDKTYEIINAARVFRSAQFSKME